jgi:hypothetical protein
LNLGENTTSTEFLAQKGFTGMQIWKRTMDSQSIIETASEDVGLKLVQSILPKTSS